jgi:hypothetical protein
MSNGNNCGCGPADPVQPGNQIIVPPGTHIIQQPCAVAAGQYAPVAPSVFNSGQVSGPSQNQQAACLGFSNPVVKRSFVTASVGQTGSFFSDCAGIWGLPGLILYFPSQGQLEVIGVSQSSVVYKNRTMAPGTEILEGTQFAIGIPMPPVEIIDDGGDDTPTNPTPTPEPTYQDKTQLSNIRGVLNNELARILPVANHTLVGRGGYWQRRQLGQMRYPLASIANPLLINETANTKTWTLALPSKPTYPDEITSVGLEIHMRIGVSKTTGTGQCSVAFNAGNFTVIRAYSPDVFVDESSSFIMPITKDATTFQVSTVKEGASGIMSGAVWVLAYYY